MVQNSSVRHREMIAGILATAFEAPWIYRGVLLVLDWTGRAQSAMILTQYLGVFATPVAFVIELLGTIGLLFFATRLEASRESLDRPLVILAWSRPEKPKRKRLWIKLAVAVCLVSTISALYLSERIQNRCANLVQKPIPPEVLSLINQSKLWCEAHRYLECSNFASQALSIDSDSPDALNNRAFAEGCSGQWDQALADGNRAKYLAESQCAGVADKTQGNLSAIKDRDRSRLCGM
jgi:hypothetical protein